MITLKSILNKNRVLLSFKHLLYMSTKLINHEINTIYYQFLTFNHLNFKSCELYKNRSSLNLLALL